MFKKILLALIILIGSVIGFAATRPNSFRIQRSAIINANQDKIFPLVEWTEWSPWEKIDPALKRTYSGPESGKGAVYGWEGNSDVGQGSMEIVESVPNSKIVMKLDFIKPFEGHNITEFSFEPNGSSTKVTWTMSGPSPLLAKVIGLFCNMDQMIGSQFEKGLANLKVISEK